MLAVIVAVLPTASALACTLDADCDDGVACNGIETCETQSNTCVAGQAVDCSHLSDQCNEGVCIEPSGTCTPVARMDGFRCDDGELCTLEDTCEGGVCVGRGGADTDDDGYCDTDEIQVGCNPDDGAEIPMQGNLFSGGVAANPGEILLTFQTPLHRAPKLSVDANCSTGGRCNQVTNFCTAGRLGDACSVDSDCDQQPRTCRIVINYGNQPDIALLIASLKIPRQRATDVRSLFNLTPGCSQKVDLQLPQGFGKARLKLKASGALAGRQRTDTDRITIIE